jgi:hypothetical protein
MADPLSIQEFAAKIKARDSRLKDVPDDELVRKTLERRPELIKYVRTSEPRPQPKSTGDKVLETLPVVGATIGGIAGAPAGGVGAVGGAALGGAAGKAAEQLGEKFITHSKPLGTSGEAAKDITWEGIKQGAYELGGRVIGAIGGRVVGKILGKKAPIVGKVIKDTTIPESMGQATGKTGGFLQTTEHYISKTFLGSALKRLKSAQEDASRQILAKLSGVVGAAPAEVATNWAKAREATRAVAQPIYESFADVEAKTVAPVASNILKDQSLKLSAKATTALEKLAANPLDDLAKGLGYADVSTAEQAEKKLGAKTWNDLVAKEKALGTTKVKPSTIADAIQARHELGDMAATAKDPNDRRLLLSAWEDLNKAIDKSLTPEQQSLKKEADRLWRRSYIMDRISRRLEVIGAGQDPKSAPNIASNAFTKMVNGLAKSGVGRDASGNIVKRTSELDVLFDSPEDKKAMVDLASFLSTKYQSLGSRAGVGERLAQIGLVLEALRIPYLAATGQEKQARKEAGYLGGLYILSSVLANPGGAKLVLEYFKAPVNEAGPLALRLGMMVLGKGEKPKEEEGMTGNVSQTVKSAEDMVDQLVASSGGSKAAPQATAVQ